MLRACFTVSCSFDAKVVHCNSTHLPRISRHSQRTAVLFGRLGRRENWSLVDSQWLLRKLIVEPGDGPATIGQSHLVQGGYNGYGELRSKGPDRACVRARCCNNFWAPYMQILVERRLRHCFPQVLEYLGTERGRLTIRSPQSAQIM